ncbi:HlyD family secretion protein [Flammeovirga agarivorans]|uniref:HlyD family secretion protein n=1 Tax=Flammeovirga agarivorans TaxID=2726742 RepID=A0A7X8SIQ8_9BACT|nr:HlyD family secretion protein [Flammeovirga agarivorans]NLR90975.1 HlyD family secretion protein [Flammeovirga agarivorans]
MKKHQILLTAAVVAIAIAAVATKYYDYIVHPWTRNGQVMANIIQITPRVSGPIVTLHVKDNQFVKAGDLLFEIDPRTFQAALDEASAQLQSTGDNVHSLEEQIRVAKADVDVAKASVDVAKSNILEVEAQIPSMKAEFDRQTKGIKNGSTSKHDFDAAKSNYDVILEQYKAVKVSLEQSKANLAKSKAALSESIANLGKHGSKNAQFQAGLANLHQAELNLEFTKVVAPVDGYVTNLNLRLGSNTVANQPALALVDVNSYWVYGFFKETDIKDIDDNDRAVVTLMSNGESPIEGYVESIGWGISQSDGSTGNDLLPSISPTFDWIRLAQRIPVRVKLVNVPKHVKLRVGSTASVLVNTEQKYQAGNTSDLVASPSPLR